MVRRVLITPPVPHPHPRLGWGMLETLPDVLDLRSVPGARIPALLTDVRRLQRATATAPLLIVDRADYAVQRLIASSDVAGLVVASDVPRPLLAACLALPQPRDTALGGTRPWMALTPPLDRWLPTPTWIPFLAALGCAPTLDIAAAWCGMSRATGFRLLGQVQDVLGLPPATRRTPEAWCRLILDTLTGALR